MLWETCDNKIEFIFVFSWVLILSWLIIVIFGLLVLLDIIDKLLLFLVTLIGATIAVVTAVVAKKLPANIL